MAIGDNFNAYTDGQTLSSQSANWDVFAASGSGVMTLDMHDDHSDGTLVVDMSTTGDNFGIYQIQVGSADHFAEVDVFLDSMDEAQVSLSAQSGPIVRGNQSSMGSGAFDGYAAFLERDINGQGPAQVFLRIYRIDNDVPTLLASSVDISGQTYDASTTTATVRLEVDGSTLTAYSDGNELVSTTDATYSAGQFCGVRQNRILSASDGQPFFDNFSGDVLAVGQQTIDLVGPSVSVTPGVLTVTPGPVGIDLVGPAVSVTPGTLTLTRTIDLQSPTVSVTPGVLQINRTIDLIGPTVAVTPGTATVAPGPATVDLVGPTVGVTPGDLTVTPGTVAIDLAGPTVTTTPGTLSVTAGDADIVLSAPVVTATPGTLEVTPGAATVSLIGPVVTVTPGVVQISVSIDLEPAAVGVTPGVMSVLAGPPAVSLITATVTVTAGVLTVTGGQVITTTPQIIEMQETGARVTVVESSQVDVQENPGQIVIIQEDA